MTIRSAGDADWPAMSRLGATCFGSFKAPETLEASRTLMPADAIVVACDGSEIVGMSMYLDLSVTVPGGAALPMAGATWVAVAPTHRRRGVLRDMYTELHARMARAGYSIAGLLASEGGIYSRFGYGPATIEERRSVERRFAQFHQDVPELGGVRVIEPAQYREELADIYERWRLRTPGGLHTPHALWEELLADRETNRDGGSQLFALLHPDGFAMYRVHRDDDRKSAEVTKLCAVTADAHIALWRVLLGLDLMETVSITTHPADPLPYLLTDARQVRTTGTEDSLWLRMLDIPAVLEARTYQADLSVVLDVADGFLSAGGRFALDVRDGRAHCAPTDKPADVHLDVGVLGSMYLGVHLASVYAAAHRLGCKDSALLHRLDAAFASDVPAELGYGF
jgi:predicted acetyltransferase